jgi:predicted ATPase
MIHRFGEYEIDDQLFELRKGRAIVPIQPKAFDILRCLVDKQDVVVSRAELMGKVWPGVVVTNDSLAQAIMAARAAIGDDGDEPTFIHTVRGRGYRFVGQVQSSPRPERGESPSKPGPAPSSLIGRAASMAALRDALEAARAGRGGVCLVTGETGVGKTRLIEELAAITEGVNCILVSCDGPDGTPDLWPFIQALRALRTAGASLTEALEPLAEGRVPASTFADPQARFALFDATASALTASAKAQPLLLVIDDLHLADLDTLRLLALLSPQLRSAPMLLVAAYSSTTPRLPSFRAAMSALSQEPSTSVLRLESLTRDEVAQVVEQANGQSLSAALVDKVFEKTKGNPLLVTQLVHVLKTPAPDERVGPGGMATSVLVGGDGIRDTITGMLAALSEPANRVLDVAAVFGTTFPLAPLAAAIDQSNEHVLGALDAADVARVVTRSGSASYRFTYPLVRDVIYKRLLSSERARLHGRVASALEKHLGEAPDHRRVAEIADHLVEAAAAGDVNAAVDCSLRAAELANLAGDAEAAARYAVRGLEAFRYAQAPDNARRAQLCTLRDAAPSRK